MLWMCRVCKKAKRRRRQLELFFLLTGRFAKRAVSARAASSKLPDSRPADLSTALSSITFHASLCSNDLFPNHQSIPYHLLLSIMAASLQVSPRIQEVRDLTKQDPSKAANTYQTILSEGPGSTEASSRDYEQALIGLGELYRDAKKPQDIADLIKTSRDTFSSFAKAKTAKLGTSKPSDISVALLTVTM